MIDLPEIYENANREAEEDEMSNLCNLCEKVMVYDSLATTCDDCAGRLSNMFDEGIKEGIKTGLKMAMEIVKKYETNGLTYDDGTKVTFEISEAIQHKLDEMEK